jgi:polysaccharide export outer membrane protein
MGQVYHTPVCPDDLLTITVTAWDPAVVTPFNPPTYAYSTIIEGETTVQAAQGLFTYLVDKDGYIDYPVLGRVHVQGLTKHELAEKLRKDISKYIDDPLVKVSLVNFKVTVLGEVNRPGTISIRNDRVSILDVLGSVGDVTINANRTNLLIVRDNNGSIERTRVDLTDPAIFASPYYYLQQNDVVYVEPNDAKKRNSRYSQADQYNITLFSSIMSAISVITLVLTNIF